MVYNSQMGAVMPKGIGRKKLRYAPMIQEQAQRGIATNLVAQAKEKQQYDEERAFQETQARVQQEQWKKDFNARKKQNEISNTMAGISTAVNFMDLMGFF